MAWAFIAGATLAANAAAPGVSWNAGNLGAAPGTNNKIFVAVVTSNNGAVVTTTGVTDSMGNVYTKDITPLLWTEGAFNGEGSIWSAVMNGAGTPSSITPAFSGAGPGSVGLAAAAYSGLDTTAGAGAGVDISKTATGSGGTFSDSAVSVTTTAVANELLLGVHWDQGDTAVLSNGTTPVTFTLQANNGNNSNGESSIEDVDAGAAGSVIRATTRTATGTTWAAAAIAYKLAGAAAVSTLALKFLGL
jgi:hypothetical protein